MHSIENDKLKVVINPIGAELATILKKSNAQEYLWQGDPEIWASQAPVLFPNIGGFKDGEYVYNGQTYRLPKHGFIRYNDTLSVVEKGAQKLVLGLKSTAETLKMYPFHFEFKISFELVATKLIVVHTIENVSDYPMYFSVGGHPAFCCPSFAATNYNDYYITLDNGAGSPSYLLGHDGLITENTVAVFEGNRIPLTRDIFNNDALIFKDIKAKRASLWHKTKGEVLSVAFSDFPDLGIWAKPNGDFVCIEPWLGYADIETTDKELIHKEGIQTLKEGQVHSSSYQITIV